MPQLLLFQLLWLRHLRLQLLWLRLLLLRLIRPKTSGLPDSGQRRRGERHIPSQPERPLSSISAANTDIFLSYESLPYQNASINGMIVVAS